MKDFLIILYYCISYILVKIELIPIDIDSFDTAVRIMKWQEHLNRSFCLVAEDSPSSNEFYQISNIVANMMQKDINDKTVKNATEKILKNYIEAQKNSSEIERMIKNKFLDEDCQPKISETSDLIKIITNEFSSDKNSYLILNCAKVLVIGCSLESIQKEQFAYIQSDTKGKEQKIVDMFYFNKRTTESMLSSTEEEERFLLIADAQFWINLISNIHKAPHEYVVECFIDKSESYYKLNKLEWVKDIYLYFLKYLHENENCSTSILSPSRKNEIYYLLIEISLGSLDLVHLKAVLYSVEALFDSFESTNVFFSSGLVEYLHDFMDVSRCTFDTSKFSVSFRKNRDDILNYRFGKRRLDNFGQVFTIFCILSQLNTISYDSIDDILKSKLLELMDIYTFFIKGMENKNKSFTERLITHVETVRDDSKFVDKFIRANYFNNLKYTCMFIDSEASFMNRILSHLVVLERYINNTFAPEHCHNGFVSAKTFSKALSVLFFGVYDKDISLFEYIFECILKILDVPYNFKNIIWNDVIDFDGRVCLGKKNINYSTLSSDKNNLPIMITFESFKRSITERCLFIKSVAFTQADSINPLSIFDKALLLSSFYSIETGVQFYLLPLEERVKIVKTYIGTKTLASKQGPGRNAMLDCEIYRLVYIGHTYEFDLFSYFYSQIVNSYFDNNTCSFKPDTFNDNNLYNVVHVLLKNHTELNSHFIGDIVTDFIPSFKEICINYKLSLSHFTLSTEITHLLINNRTCDFDEIDDDNLSQKIKDIYYMRNAKIHLNQTSHYINILSCYALKEVKHNIDKLENKKQLYSNEKAILDEILSSYLAKHENLTITRYNFYDVMDNITKTKEFKPFSSLPLKESIAECYMFYSYFKDKSVKGGNNILSRGAIIGLIVGGVFLLIFIIVIVIYYLRLKRRIQFSVNSNLSELIY